ncbi:MAG: succinyl-diaminopimelate desuccinylase [Magnetococcales bacterium]|nr:succinyl-diaminopimelate desuccinylase [Magnetococcales bacterium]
MNAFLANGGAETSAPVLLAAQLIRAPSVTPVDAGCQEILIRRLETLGFTVHRLRFGVVENFYARLGVRGRHFCFAGHTDVVPPGNLEKWTSDPFGGVVRDGHLIGRGAADMKGGLAAMVVAVEGFLQARPEFPEHDSLSFLITGDEEADAVDGTVKVLEWLEERRETLDYCLVGEPTSITTLGDCLKHGRRGSVNGVLRFHGRQGHVAHPHLADNPIHRAAPLLARLAALPFDAGDVAFPPSSLQITALQAGEGANNVIPGQLMAQFNIRFSPASTPASLEAALREVLDAGDLPLGYDLTMTVSGLPFLTGSGVLGRCLDQAVRECLDTVPVPSTSGGTSDARFISRCCPQTLELGLVGKTIHKVNEAVPVEDLVGLTRVYQRLLEIVFA